jgi:hypothetical protein
MPNCPFGWLAFQIPMTGFAQGYGYYYAPAIATTAHVVVNVKFYTDDTESTVSSQGSGTTAITVTSQ